MIVKSVILGIGLLGFAAVFSYLVAAVISVWVIACATWILGLGRWVFKSGLRQRQND